VRQQITLANTSISSVTKDATLEPDNVTLAFSNRLRTFLWLVEPLNATTKEMASNLLGFLQFLSPDRVALSAVVTADSDAKSLIMANAGNANAQLDASKSSKMYCGGHLTTFRHS
jgi:hypothetical protein